MTQPRRLTPTLALFLALGLFAPASDASQPAPRQQTSTKAAKRTPPPRKEIKLTPEVRQRLSTATVKRKPVRYVPLSKKQVRKYVSPDERPARANKSGKPKRVSYTALTKELNALERKLASQGYSLRDNSTVVFHEHRPNRAKIDQQLRQVRGVVRAKPKRAPMSRKEVRGKVRRSAKPPARRAPGPRAPNGFWSLGSEPSAAADFGWTPAMGEAEIGSAFLDTRANFSGQLGGSDPGLHGSMVVRAGGYVLGERVDVVRFDATLDVPPDGTYQAKVKATLIGGFEHPLYDKRGTQPLTAANALELWDFAPKFHARLFVIGYPVDIDVILTPTIKIDFDARLDESSLEGRLAPEVRVDAKLEAYVDALVLEAGVGGSSLLLSATPTLWGGAYYGGAEGTTASAYLGGNVKFHFLQGRLYAFIDAGVGPWTKRFETELWNYAGWSYDYPVFEWSSSDEP